MYEFAIRPHMCCGLVHESVLGASRASAEPSLRPSKRCADCAALNARSSGLIRCGCIAFKTWGRLLRAGWHALHWPTP